MKLSIIIVNYNVKFFLEQCLNSLIKALKNIDAEIIVVDNNSVDGSCQMIRQKFPEVILIENKANKGFSVANNQGIKIAKGEYILILNPDTIVEENTLTKCIEFFSTHKDAGAIGVKLIDGKGRFLPESKRSLPTPFIAFYKIFGLSSLFPKSKIFGKYHLSYYDENEINEVDILPGAFMMIRKETLDKTGLFDENFFMYGEDIDLSYRIIKSGYKNYYFPETTIIHFKGESTKKGSLNYVRVFYNAMIIFARKHFSKKNAQIFILLIYLAIYFRASIAVLNRISKKIFLPFADTFLIYSGYYFISKFWSTFYFGSYSHFSPYYYNFIIPSYMIIMLISVYYSGGYDKPIKLFNIIKGLSFGVVLIILLYSLLPSSLRCSRFLIIIGYIWAIISMLSIRYILSFLKIKPYIIYSSKNKNIAIIGDKKEFEHAKNILSQQKGNDLIIGYISTNGNKDIGPEYLGDYKRIDEIIRINKIDEILFSSKILTSEEIIKKMLDLSSFNLEFKIINSDNITIIGSNSIQTIGEIFVLNLNSINKLQNIRIKRLFDCFSAIILFTLSPILVFIYKKPKNFFKNIYKVFLGKLSMVGYFQFENINDYYLPKIKKGILNPTDIIKKENLSDDEIVHLNTLYAKDYNLLIDIRILLFNLKKLERII
jgi:GT2 family glycosyltransferase